MSWWNRVTNLIRSKRLSKAIDRELAFHIEERVDELVASGMDAGAARRQAVRQFGDPLRQRERVRDADVLVWLETVVADVRQAWRALRGNPGFALVAILSLALGIGANTAIFSVIDALLLEALPVHRPEELVRITRNEDATHVTNPIWEQLRDRQDFFSGVFAYTSDTRFNLAPGGEVRMVSGSWVSGDYFTTLGVRPALGRVLTRADDVRGCAGVAVLSHAFWRSEYGDDAGVIGRSVSLNRHAYTIIGVAARASRAWPWVSRYKCSPHYVPGRSTRRACWLCAALGICRSWPDPGTAWVWIRCERVSQRLRQPSTPQPYRPIGRSSYSANT